jgi:sortase A
MNITADRGGPFVRSTGTARNWMRAAAPGIAFRFPSDESSPIGGAKGSNAIFAGANARTASTVSANIAPDPVPTDSRLEVLHHHAARNAIHFRRQLVILCIALLAGGGTAAFGHGAYIYAKAQLAQVLLHAAKPWPWADTHPVARLMAPGQDADVLVLAGASGRTLAFGPGHLDGSALPGDAGNAVITAHRDTHFRFLQDTAPGDLIIVERVDGASRHFRIRRSYVADARDLKLPRDTLVSTLTLVTCYPFDALNPGGPLRYVVVAEAA